MNYAKEILMLGIGGIVGFAAGWYFSKKRIEARTDEEIDSIKKYYLEKQLKSEAKMQEINDKIEEKILNIEETYEEPAEKTNYNKIGGDEKVLAENEHPEEEEPTKPYLITEDEFLNEKNENEKLSLTYYIYDDTLADDCDEMIDIEETISSDIYNTLADADSDIFVRNPITSIDYEIMRVEGSFGERYGGF